jgi:hypothetical protein
MILRDKIDDFVESGSDVSVTDKAGIDALKEARDYWSRAKKGEVVEDAIKNAESSRSGFENGLRIEFDKLRRSKKFRMFSKDEQRAIEDVVKGGPVSNTLRLIGKGAVRGIVSGGIGAGLPGAIGYSAAGGAGLAGALIIPTVGEVGRFAATRATKSAADKASAKMRAGKNPANVREKLAQLLDQFGDRLAATDKNMAFAVDMARRAKGNVNPYLTRQLIAQLENMERISQQRQALEQEE